MIGFCWHPLGTRPARNLLIWMIFTTDRFPENRKEDARTPKRWKEWTQAFAKDRKLFYTYIYSVKDDDRLFNVFSNVMLKYF